MTTGFKFPWYTQLTGCFFPRAGCFQGQLSDWLCLSAGWTSGQVGRFRRHPARRAERDGRVSVVAAAGRDGKQRAGAAVLRREEGRGRGAVL